MNMGFVELNNMVVPIDKERKNILGMRWAWGRSNQARNLVQEQLFPTPEQLILRPWSGACNPGGVFGADPSVT